MNKDELIQLAKDILIAIGKNEEENEAMLQRFLDNVPDPNASNLFFLWNTKILKQKISLKSFFL